VAFEIKKAGAKAKTKTLIFGPPGQGKTVLLGTANLDERTAPILVLDFDGGESSLKGTDVEVAQIRDWHDYNQAFAYLSSDEGKKKYKSIAIDSLSETHIFSLLKILDRESSKRKDKDQSTDQLQMQDYGQAMMQMQRLVREFRDLDYHVFYTCWAKDDKDPKVGLIKVPALGGQLAISIPGMMEVCAYLALTESEEGETQRALLLHGNTKFRTKARTAHGILPPEFIVDPTIGKLLDAIGYGT
jgi:phage nucleotide-binding protein